MTRGTGSGTRPGVVSFVGNRSAYYRNSGAHAACGQNRPGHARAIVVIAVVRWNPVQSSSRLPLAGWCIITGLKNINGVLPCSVHHVVWHLRWAASTPAPQRRLPGLPHRVPQLQSRQLSVCVRACLGVPARLVVRCGGRSDVANAMRAGMLCAVQRDHGLMRLVPALRCIEWWRYSWDQGMRLYHLHLWWQRRRHRAEAETHLRNIAVALRNNLRPTCRLWCHLIVTLTRCQLPIDLIDTVCGFV